jgi:hypothetical protein
MRWTMTRNTAESGEITHLSGVSTPVRAVSHYNDLVDEDLTLHPDGGITTYQSDVPE